jgi:hypothetical protein
MAPSPPLMRRRRYAAASSPSPLAISQAPHIPAPAVVVLRRPQPWLTTEAPSPLQAAVVPSFHTHECTTSASKFWQVGRSSVRAAATSPASFSRTSAYDLRDVRPPHRPHPTWHRLEFFRPTAPPDLRLRLSIFYTSQLGQRDSRRRSFRPDRLLFLRRISALISGQ